MGTKKSKQCLKCHRTYWGISDDKGICPTCKEKIKNEEGKNK